MHRRHMCTHSIQIARDDGFLSDGVNCQPVNDSVCVCLCFLPMLMPVCVTYIHMCVQMLCRMGNLCLFFRIIFLWHLCGCVCVCDYKLTHKSWALLIRIRRHTNALIFVVVFFVCFLFHLLPFFTFVLNIFLYRYSSCSYMCFALSPSTFILMCFFLTFCIHNMISILFYINAWQKIHIPGISFAFYVIYLLLMPLHAILYLSLSVSLFPWSLLLN